MSHLKERKEKICLNCNTALYGRYCHVCGQENLEPKETVWHLVNHFFQDITHFDGKFFSTVKLLLIRPGFLSKEYMQGRRASYLNPVRMYVFTSAIFFIIFFSFANPGNMVKIEEKPESVADWEKQKAKLINEMKNEDSSDSSDHAEGIKMLDNEIAAAKRIYGDTTTRRFTKSEVALLFVQAGLDSLEKEGARPDVANKVANAIGKHDSSVSNQGDVNMNLSGEKYKTPEAYDSAQIKLPADKRDGWFKKIIKRQLIVINEEFHQDKRGYIKHFSETLLHSFPKILFISLPFFALILKLVYVRRSQYYYTSHGIFTIHLYCATFILMLIAMLAKKLQEGVSWQWFGAPLGILNFALWVYMLIYLYIAMRKFYGQGWFKTFIKYLIVSFLALLLTIFLLAIFILISAVSI